MPPMLRFGSSGAAVTQLQQALNAGRSALPKLVPDGVFGSKTGGRVREFQRSSNLVQDGIVGPNTYDALMPLIDKIKGVVDKIVSPEDEAQARQRILAIVQAQYTALRWLPSSRPGLGNPRIAGKLCANPNTRARQGGLQLAAIFSAAGAPSAAKCLTLSRQAEAMYQRAYTAKERNQTDIVSWCGIFALYVYKMAGLKMSSWPLRWAPGPPKPEHELRVLGPSEAPKPGDIGIKDPAKGNHHFVAVEVNGGQVKSIDGNCDPLMQIDRRQYTIGTIKSHGGGFLTPIWERVLAT